MLAAKPRTGGLEAASPVGVAVMPSAVPPAERRARSSADAPASPERISLDCGLAAPWSGPAERGCATAAQSVPLALEAIANLQVEVERLREITEQKVRLPYPLVDGLIGITQFKYPQAWVDEEIKRQQAANQAAKDGTKR